MKKQPYLNQFYMMATLSVIFIFLIGSLRPQPMSSVITKEKFWADKVHSKSKFEVLVAGDSRVYRGISSAVLSEELGGLSVLNFGFSSGGLNLEIFRALEQRLEQQENAIVLLGITPFSLTPKAYENAHFKQELSRDKKEVFSRRYVGPVIHFFDPIKPADIFNTGDQRNGYYERFHKNGWVASKKIPADKTSALKSYRKNFRNNKVSPDILDELYNQVALWKANKIRVFAFRLPSTKEMELLEREISGFDELEIKTRLSASGAEWIEIGNSYNYNSYDGSHLDEESAERFSRYLGREIRKKI